MDIKYKSSCGTLTFYMYGEFDEYSASNAKIILDKILLDNVNCKRIVFDLSGVSFMDSTGIGLLIGRYKKIKQFNIQTNITGAQLSTEKVLQLAGIYSIMPRI